MKKMILILPFILQACVYEMIAFSDSESHIRVYDVPGAKYDLFTKANAWMVSVFNNAESVIQHSDKEEGVIIGKYLMTGGITPAGYGIIHDSRVFAIIDIRLKDNKARIEIKPQSSWQYQGEISVYDYDKMDAIADMESLSESFRKSISKESIDF